MVVSARDAGNIFLFAVIVTGVTCIVAGIVRLLPVLRNVQFTENVTENPERGGLIMLMKKGEDGKK